MKKQYVVFGAGRFGRSIAVTLQSRGCEVIVVDRDPEVIEDIADEVSYAICANVEDPDIFADLGMKNLDGAIVAITARQIQKKRASFFKASPVSDVLYQLPIYS